MRNKNIPFFILKSLEEINKKEIIHKQYKRKIYNKYYKTSSLPVAQKFIYAKSYKEIITND
ncbi:MAG: hypothetical protein H6586_08250 [Flavobacteriales bacterium]|nr:hypothetical protein [Flavobacteriales bacterium]